MGEAHEYDKKRVQLLVVAAGVVIQDVADIRHLNVLSIRVRGAEFKHQSPDVRRDALLADRLYQLRHAGSNNRR